jgi:hypothetical protein
MAQPIPKDPVQLVQKAGSNQQVLIYASDNGVKVELRFDGDDLWLNQDEIAELFGVERSVVTKHLGNIYSEGELNIEATRAKIARVRREGRREVTRQIDEYNLDAIISVGYRVGSKQGTFQAVGN